MLSILIPTYNYGLKNLVSGLKNALNSVDVAYEVIALEDGSTQYLKENSEALNSLNNAQHIISKTNNGRLTSRLQLAKQAKYDWLLFIDSDVLITEKLYLKNYLSKINSRYEVIYGGFCYSEEKPDQNQILRWKYGKTYEQIDAEKRNKNPYKVVISGNFLINKTTFIAINSEIDNDGYGYDNFFGAIMKTKNTKVLHIKNNVIHSGLDSNSSFLDKVKKSVVTIHNYHIKNPLKLTENSLLETYKSISKIGITGITSSIFKTTKGSLEKQLLSHNPNLRLLQFYKLGYLCSLSSHKK